jgi:hypothetical protein
MLLGGKERSLKVFKYRNFSLGKLHRTTIRKTFSTETQYLHFKLNFINVQLLKEKLKKNYKIYYDISCRNKYFLFFIIIFSNKTLKEAGEKKNRKIHNKLNKISVFLPFPLFFVFQTCFD